MAILAQDRQVIIFKKAIFSLLPACLLLVAAEAGLRVYTHVIAAAQRGRALPLPSQRNRYQREDSVLGYSLMPGYKAEGIRVNAIGFRGKEIERIKPTGVFRIVAIGDSTTFGLSGQDCPYPVQLEEIANDRAAGQTAIEVVNGGVEGYSSPYALRLLETRIAALDPDLILIYIGWNDLYATNPYRANVHSLRQPVQTPASSSGSGRTAQALLHALNRLYVVQYLRGLILVKAPRWKATRNARGRGNEDDKPVHPNMTDEYRWHLKRMVAVIRGMGAEPALMTLPTVLSEAMSQEALGIVHYPSWAQGDYLRFLEVVDAFNATIRRVAADTEVYLIDNATYIDTLGAERKEPLFFDSLHMHCDGYALLAKKIYRELATGQLIPAD